MQPNPFAQSDKKRFRIDAIARHVVTVFGLMVLAMFFLLILHILGNAMPLLNKPGLVFEDSHKVDDVGSTLSILTLSDKTMILSNGECEVLVHEASKGAVNPVASFAHPCSSTLVSVKNQGQHDTHYALIRSDGLVEMFGLSDTSSKIKRQLTGSFVIPDYDQLAGEHPINTLDWTLETYQQKIVLYTALGGDEYLSIWTVLNSLEPALRRVFSAPAWFAPLVRFDQVIVSTVDGIHILNKGGDRVQSLSDVNTDSASLLTSPNQQTLYLSLPSGGTQVWRNANVQGTFTFSQAGVVEGLDDEALAAIVFDRQTLIAIAADKDGSLHIFNSASNEVVSSENIDLRPADLYWHNNKLYVLTNDNLRRYSVENSAGITTWKTLFSPVQYTGYTQAKYIWQTSQSADYAEPKFSLVPLIIGSLKASVLALFVAIPLALGAATYTAYFASSRIRNWVKPSIEMVEAIPSVIIGFVAAVWLAPFAERSLLALLVLLICTPFIIISLAIVHGFFKQTDLYHAVRKYYLLIVSLAVLAIVIVIFQSSIWLQAVVMANTDSWLGQQLSEITITKTTIIVALALGIAVAPTIYSLVDDALFEVPEGVKQASFALGATELQTLIKVVLVVALPSIVSAIMLGLGRAFGETMIVLMVTGNTPVADWDLLSGLRALTSNLTIELQESSVGTAHYHILFLTAAILFAFTFAINTIAALLKRRLQVGNQHV
jgi:phosphate transport system permease protein